MDQQQVRLQFVEMYDQLADVLFRRFYFKLSKKERAKELVQETFLRAWEYLSRDKEITNLKSFIYKIANNLIIDEYRRKQSVSLDVLTEAGFDVESKESSENILQSAEAKQVLREVRQLPEKYKEVLVMRYVDGLSPKTIGQIVGQTENTVSVRINRGIKKLQEVFKVTKEKQM